MHLGQYEDTCDILPAVFLLLNNWQQYFLYTYNVNALWCLPKPANCSRTLYGVNVTEPEDLVLDCQSQKEVHFAMLSNVLKGAQRSRKGSQKISDQEESFSAFKRFFCRWLGCYIIFTAPLSCTAKIVWLDAYIISILIEVLILPDLNLGKFVLMFWGLRTQQINISVFVFYLVKVKKPLWIWFLA